MSEQTNPVVNELLAELGINKLKKPELQQIAAFYLEMDEEYIGAEAAELLKAAKSNIERTHAIAAAANVVEMVPVQADEELAKKINVDAGTWVLISFDEVERELDEVDEADSEEEKEEKQDEETKEEPVASEDLHTRADKAIAAGTLRFENRLIINIRPKIKNGIKKYELDGVDGATYLATKEELEELV
jgi:hypothetical protein